MKKWARKLMAVLILAMMTACVSPLTASAATVHLKPMAFITARKKVNRKAIRVKKGTHTIVMPAGGTGYVKFKAPRNKRYTFTVSYLESGTGGFAHGEFYILKDNSKDEKSVTMVKVGTQGGKYAMLHVATEERLYDKEKYSLLESRYGRLKLKKKEMVYLFFSFRAGDILQLTIQ